MALHPHFGLERDTLLSIQRIASVLAQELSAYRRPLEPVDTLEAIVFPPLDISFPPDILSPIQTLKIPEETRQAILQRFHKLFDDLCHNYTTSYKEACQARRSVQNFDSDLGVVRNAFRAQFQRHCFPLVQSQIKELAKYQSPLSDAKPLFNGEYTPMLEKYFQLNGYPSVVHRSVLASKSGMTTRQIEVWFQNHRNRAKKEGRSIPRLDSDFPLKQSLALLQQDGVLSQIRPPTPPAEVSIPTKHVSSQTRVPKFLSLFDDCSSRPPHAFPATKDSGYPDPFPNDNGRFEFPPPIWRRKPATVPIVSLAVDMDEFVQTFHLKLNFSENPRRRGLSPMRRDSPSLQPWFTATITFPSSAPHPALVQTTRDPRPVPPIPSPSFSIPISEPIFGSSSLPTSIAPLPTLPNTVPGRKTKPLPRRTPARSQSKTFNSRTSSFSSDISSGSRASSSPELLTPPPLPNLDLPVFHGDGQQDHLFDFSRTELDANYSLSNYLVSQNSNPPNTYSSSNKFVDTPLFDNPFTEFGHNLGELIF